MKRNLAAAMTAALIVSATNAFGAENAAGSASQEMSFGGIEVGTTACDVALAKAKESGAVADDFISAITGESGFTPGCPKPCVRTETPHAKLSLDS